MPTTATNEASTYGGTPILLVVFDPGTGTVYRYTNADAAFTYLGQTYTPTDMIVGDVEQSDEDGAGSLEISVSRTDPVAALFVGGVAPLPVAVTVFRTHRDASDALTVFFGDVASCQFEDAGARLLCESERQALRRTVPRVVVQSTCPWMLGDADCGIDLTAYRTAYPVLTVTNNGDGTQTLTFDVGGSPFAADTYNAGFVELSGARAYVNTQPDDHTLILMTPLAGVAVGSSVFLTQGCDRTTGANGCTKFANIARFGGFPGLANRNPFDAGLR